MTPAASPTLPAPHAPPTLPTTGRARIAGLTFYLIILLLGYLLYRIFEPFLVPLGWAAVLAIFVFPWHVRVERRFGRARAAVLSTLIVTAVIIVPGLLVLTAFVRETSAAIEEVSRDSFARPLMWALEHWPSIRRAIPGAENVDLEPLIDQAATRVAGFVAARAGGLLADIALFIFALFVTLFALFFLLRDADAIARGIRRLLPFDEPRRERMIRQTQDLVYASVTSGLAIAALQGLAGGLLFALLGLDGAVFWGVVMAFLSFLPFFGTWVVWLPTGIWLIASGSVGRGVVLIGVGAAVVGSIDNILRPIVLSGRAQMNGLLMFISLLGGLSVFGLLGLVLGPLIVALVAGLFDAYAPPLENDAEPDGG